MGTSSGGDGKGDLHRRLADLATRKKELEDRLAAKNDELYKLCVTEVALTGILPPETPVQPQPHQPPQAHRLLHQTQSAQGLPHPQHPQPQQQRQQRSRVEYPPRSLVLPNHGRGRRPHRHRTMTSTTPRTPAAPPSPSRSTGALSQCSTSSGAVSRLSRSHPSLAPVGFAAPAPAAGFGSIASVSVETEVEERDGPLVYRYAAQLKARARREQLKTFGTVALGPDLVEFRRAPAESPPSGGLRYRPPPEQRVKKKEWCESSLDSPSDVPPDPRRPPGRRSPLDDERDADARSDRVRQSRERVGSFHVRSPSPSEAPRIPARTAVPLRAPPSPPTVGPVVPFESPKNCTVVESGRWIPYREVTKPFEMSDFYKYSTKFRRSGPASPPTLDAENNLSLSDRDLSARGVLLGPDPTPPSRPSGCRDGNRPVPDPRRRVRH